MAGLNILLIASIFLGTVAIALREYLLRRIHPRFHILNRLLQIANFKKQHVHV